MFLFPICWQRRSFYPRAARRRDCSPEGVCPTWENGGMRSEAGQESTRCSLRRRGVAQLRRWDGMKGTANRGCKPAESARHGGEGEKQHATRIAGTHRQHGQPPVEAEDAEHPAEVVTERHQAPF